MSQDQKNWWYAKGEQRFGPCTVVELRAQAAAGQLSSADLVWQEGLANWVPASSIEGLVAAQQSISNAAQFNVVLEGTTLPGLDIATVRAQLATLLKRDIEFAGRLLNGQATTIKSGVDTATGQRYVDALRRAGANASLQPETLELDADLDAAVFAPVAAPTQVRTAAPAQVRTAATAQVAASAEIADKQAPEEYYKAAIGPNNQDFYLRYFARRDAGGSVVSWHWPAFFVAWCWMLYRKMWRWSCLYLAISLIPVIVSALVGSNPGMGALAIQLLWLVFAWAVVPMFANALYYNNIRNKIAEVRALSADRTTQLAQLSARGGTSNLGKILAIVFGLIVLAGVFAGIALPAYQDYTVRSKMAGAVMTLAGCKTAVSEYVATKNAWPEDAAHAGCSPEDLIKYDLIPAAATAYVANVEVRANGVIVVTTKNTGSKRGTTESACILVLTPGVENHAIASWTGSYAGCDAKYVPSTFR